MAINQTELKLTNNSDVDVKVYLTLGAISGCNQPVTDLPFVPNLVGFQGWFMLNKGKSVIYTPLEGIGISGNLAFGTPPLNCPTHDYPNGVNLAEFTLNNGFQGAGAQETIDISAVAGVNALIKYSMWGGGAWNAGAAYPNVTEFENKALGGNTGQVGVFPCGCDNCTEKTDPPCPDNHPPYEHCQSEPICNVQRDAQNAGGLVTISFMGFV